MQELSMNILDVAKNSIRANATAVKIFVCQNTAKKLQTITIKDNGKGMPAEMLKDVTNPFTTTRKTRKVGLGLPLLKMAAQQTGGGLCIKSAVGKGTTVTASFGLYHIDLMPLGNMGSSISTLVQASPDVCFEFYFIKDGQSFCFCTEEARQILEGLPLDTPQVVLFIKEHVNQGITQVLNGGDTK